MTSSLSESVELKVRSSIIYRLLLFIIAVVVVRLVPRSSSLLDDILKSAVFSKKNLAKLSFNFRLFSLNIAIIS
jgi:hypothetical protein